MISRVDQDASPNPASADRQPSSHDPVRPTELGAIFTKRWVASLVLDLAGYTADQPLWDRTVLEPACGHGAFLGLIVERIIASARRDQVDLRDTVPALIAMDVDPKAVEVSRASTLTRLLEEGLSHEDASTLTRQWIKQGDFLDRAPTLPTADWVVGNPPYVRIEDVSRDDMTRYRTAWPTMSGRADLYVGFYEAGLGRLAPGGRLAYICADRWMRNQYGAGLRAFVEQDYAVETCVVMHAVDAFEDRVAAYPAITVLSRADQADALVVDASDAFDAAAADRLVKTHSRGPSPVIVDDTFRASWLSTWPRGAASWPSGAPERLALLTALETRLPTLAETGAFVSVGTATGADDVYVIDNPELVEPQFAYPTLAARETTHGGIDWKNRYLVTPWTSEGLVDPSEHPRLHAYLDQNRARLEQRHVAKRSPDRWWRTIDRIDPSVATKPKLLIPDLKDRIHPVYDQGKFIPLHSLYYVTSDRWDLAVLGGLLLTDVANMFVEAYSVRMANGYMRVSAQYLRRVRVPDPDSISRRETDELRAAFWARDKERANAAAAKAYRVPTP
jgi:adenine-specific DNA-methyltransferase